MPYFSGQGRVYMGQRDAAGQPLGLKYVGNVPELKVSLSVETVDHKESTSGQRLTDLQLIKTKQGEFACTLEELIATNLQLALYGTTRQVAAGSVDNEPLPQPIVPGDLYLLKHQNVDAVIVSDSAASVKVLPQAQYSVNKAHGSLVIRDAATGGPYVEPFVVDYTHGPSQRTAMFTQPLPERWIRFEGLNTADSNRAVVIDLYRVAINPAKELSVITDELLKFELTGQVLSDSTKQADGELGQFGQIILMQR